jgi:hypothetical protein
MNDRYLPGSIAIAVAVLVIIAMYFSWRRRGRRDSGFTPLTQLPAELGSQLASIAGFYVATTVHGKPFERMAVSGLGFRSRVDLGIWEAGLVLSIPAQSEIFVPAASIERTEPATWAIDRVVERDGLVLMSWRLPVAQTTATAGAAATGAGAAASGAAATGAGSAAGAGAVAAANDSATTVDSYFRIVDHGEKVRFFEAIHRIAPGAGAQTPAESEV